jgi:hypothetical protein
MKTLTTLVIAIAVCIAVSAAAAAQTPSSAADVLGKWELVFNTQQGAVPSTLILKKDGDKIVGTIASQMGEANVEAEAKSKDVTVWFNFQGQQGLMAITMNGTLNGDSIKGTFSIGGSQGGDWEGTRAKDAGAATATTAKEPSKDAPKDAKVDVTGTWAMTLQLDTITATPSVTFKQDGEKLTGDYVSQAYGKFPLTGSVKGSDVTWSVTLNIDGNSITGTYTGSVQADGSMKGSVNIGDQLSGTFTARRKSS